MPRLARLLTLCAVAALPACASVTTGTTQDIAVLSAPAGAACQLLREGLLIAAVDATPGTARVSRSVRPMEITCSRPGSTTTSATISAGMQPMTLGNILIGGIIGLAVDAGTGALGNYPSSVTVQLPAEAPNEPPKPAPPIS